MSAKRIHIGFVWLVALFTVASCAKVMPLSGGDEDKTPPAYRGSDPDTFALNFRGKSVTIRFDEYINLKDPTREILVSPPVYPDPEYIANGKSIKIKFKDSLQPNITYVVQFGKSIEDITEANVSTGFSFVFSTGSFLDSGEVKGSVLDAFTGEPAKGMKVMLYKPDVQDSFPYKDKPFYLAYTNDQGVFSLKNLRMGDYRVFALREDNNNYVYDREGEEIAFLGDPVSAGDSVPKKLLAFREQTGKLKFMRAKAVSPVRTDFYFLGRADSVRVTPYFGLADTGYRAFETNTAKDTLTMWHRPVEADSFAVFLNAAGFSDTAVLRTNRAAPAAGSGGGGGGRRGARGTSASFATFDAAGNPKFDLYSVPRITFTEPLASFDTSRIRVLADSVRIPYRLEPDSVSPRAYRVVFAVSEKKKYLLETDSAAFTGISGKVSARASYSFGFREAIEYGAVRIVYADSVIKYPKIWQLLKQDKVIRETFGSANQNEVGFARLEPGSYRLRLIVDQNGNHTWDTGHFLTGEQPEKVIYMTEPVELKPGWDSEIIWKMAKQGRGASKN